jgi:hypothetical protein
VFRRRTRRGVPAPVGPQGAEWLTESWLRQLFDGDLERGERVLHASPATVTTERFDRPVTGWAIATNRALRIRWGLAAAVRQSLHVGYDRMRWVEVALADPHAVRLTYFDAARPTASWYQDLHLRVDSAEMATALPHLVSDCRRAEPEVPAPPADATAPEAGSVPRVLLPAPDDALPPARAAGGGHRRRGRRLARR